MQIDAHLDFVDQRHGVRFGHGNSMRRCLEMCRGDLVGDLVGDLMGFPTMWVPQKIGNPRLRRLSMSK